MEGMSLVITGGASGVGLATATMAAERGARVALVDRHESDLAEAVAGLTDKGHEALAIAGDIASPQSCAELFGEAVRAFGRVHGLANCAGHYPRVDLLEISEEDWRTSFAVHVLGSHYMMAAAVTHMRTQSEGGLETGAIGVRGRIVNVTSVDAHIAHPKNAHYAAMKAAVSSLTKSFALEFAPALILINAVAPGAIATGRAKATGWMLQHESETPLGRVAKPEDVADVILFLLSERNRYVTGENMIVSGAYTIV
jgi:NAD(P)-dependent dehydrogenase (short-subunit alcohol dehydrogenase family)